MNERNIQANLAEARKSAAEKLRAAKVFFIGDIVRSAGDSSIVVAAAASFAEVDRRTWQRWERAGELPKAALDRFWRRVEEAITAAKAKGSQP